MFTRIKLLVVIAVIVSQAALLVPALNRAKAKAYAITDLNNCRQTMFAVHLYFDGHNQILPDPGWGTVGCKDCWATSAGIGPLGSHTAASFQADYDRQAKYLSRVKLPRADPPCFFRISETSSFCNVPKIR